MKKTLLSISLGICILLFLTNSSQKSSGGKAGVTGSPGENTCAQCHNSFDLNSGNGSFSLHNDLLTQNDLMFKEDSSYTFAVEINHEGASVFGFGVEALNTTGENSGLLEVINSEETKLMNATVSNVSRTNIIHVKNGGLSDNSKIFYFKWTANNAADTTTFYASANAADNNGGTTGDYIYSTNFTITKYIEPGDTTSINELTVQNIKVYPNPSKDFIYVDALESNEQQVVYIYSSNGQVIAQEITNPINISSYPKGVYTLQVYGSNKQTIKTSRFIKL